MSVACLSLCAGGDVRPMCHLYGAHVSYGIVVVSGSLSTPATYKCISATNLLQLLCMLTH